MIFYISVCVIIPVVLISCIIFFLYLADNDIFLRILATIVGAALGTVASLLILALWYTPFSYGSRYTTGTSIESMPIVSLSSGNRISGGFTLGCGKINEISYYYFYKNKGNKDDNIYVRDKIKLEKTLIKEMPEGSEFQPRLEWEVTHYEWPKWVGPCMTKDVPNNYMLVVPYGTIVKEFSL